jgi:hypothetical protein
MRVLDGARQPSLSDEIRGHGERAFALLEQGLGSYAVREASPRGRRA